MASRENYFAQISGKIPTEVGRSLEFERIYNLPRRKTFVDYIDTLNPLLLRPDAEPPPPNKPHRLRLHQAWLLAEALEYGGVIGNLGVGVGKTLVSFLIPYLFEDTHKRPLVLVPGGLYSKTMKEFERLSRIWRGHPNIRVLSYQQISRKNGWDTLKNIVPDMFVCDEVHHLKNTSASCTRKVKRWMEEYPQTKFFGFSGTIVTRSLNDVAHLMHWALRDYSPLPVTLLDRKLWALATDEGVKDEMRPKPGALQLFCAPGETIRLGLRRRLLESGGVVATESPVVQTDNGTDVALNIFESEIKLDTPAIRKAIAQYRATRILGEEVSITALEFSRHMQELSNGYYYRWIWPNGVRDEESVLCRQAWRKYVRKIIKNSVNSMNPYDSEDQVKDAVLEGILEPPEGQWNNWARVKDRYKIKTEAVWIDDALVHKVAAWIKEEPKGRIAWAESEAFFRKFQELYPDVPVYLAGNNEIDKWEVRAPSCLASLAHRTGKNLQYGFHTNLLVELLPTGNDMEQWLGRTHRSGQQADEVNAEIIINTIENWNTFQQTRRDAQYLQDQWGAHQRLNYATLDVATEEEVIKKIQETPPNPLWVKEWILEVDD